MSHSGELPASLSALPEIEGLLEEAREDRAYAAAQSCVIHRGKMVHHSAHGSTETGKSIDTQTLFDVASITKMAVTTLSIALLLKHQELRLETYARRFFPTLDSRVTIRELLGHGSGLPAWEPLFMEAMSDPATAVIFPSNRQGAVRADIRAAAFVGSRERVVQRAASTALGQHRGTRHYSDLGFILLGRIVEVVGSSSLDLFSKREIFEPLGLKGTRFFDLAEAEAPKDIEVACTGVTRPRPPVAGQEDLYEVASQPECPDPGEVDDDNAFAMGGVAGHAGLFSSAAEMARLAWLLFEELNGANHLGLGESLRLFSEPDLRVVGPLRGLGFDLPAEADSSAGAHIGKGGPLGAIGHLGFTGCSLWLDRDRELAVALLTNRVFPDRKRTEGIRLLRPRFHDAVVSVLA